MRALITKENIFIATLAVCGLLVGCHKETNPVQPPPLKPLELLYPKGGESFKADSTVLIRWQINDSTKIPSGSVVVELSIDNGKIYSALGTGSHPLDTTSYSWTVDSSQVSDSCRIRVRDYNDRSVTDMSGRFTVHN